MHLQISLPLQHHRQHCEFINAQLSLANDISEPRLGAMKPQSDKSSVTQAGQANIQLKNPSASALSLLLNVGGKGLHIYKGVALWSFCQKGREGIASHSLSNLYQASGFVVIELKPSRVHASEVWSQYPDFTLFCTTESHSKIKNACSIM